MIKTCPICGKEFEVKEGGRGRRPTYCSPECAQAGRRIRVKACQDNFRVSTEERKFLEEKRLKESIRKRRNANALHHAECRGHFGQCGECPIDRAGCPWEEALREVKTCPWCGKKFETTDKRRRYCSDECSRKAARKKRSEWRQRKPVKKRCECCGAEFVTTCSFQKYCSAECRKEAKRKRCAPVYRKCRQCGKAFKVEKRHRVYCSAKCRAAHYAGMARKRDPSLWKKYLEAYGAAGDGNFRADFVPYRCYKKGQTSCFTCTLPPEECHG